MLMYLKISWAPGPCSKRGRGGLVSIDKKAIEVKRMGNSSSLHQSWTPHPAVVSGAGSSSSGATVPTRSASEGSGTQSTPDEPPNACGPESMSGDAGLASPDADVGVGRLEVADTEAWEWVSVRATRGFAARQGKHSVELEVTPVGTRRRRAVGSTESSRSEDRSTLRCVTSREKCCRDLVMIFSLFPASCTVTRAEGSAPGPEQSSNVVLSTKVGFPGPNPMYCW